MSTFWSIPYNSLAPWPVSRVRDVRTPFISRRVAGFVVPIPTLSALASTKKRFSLVSPSILKSRAGEPISLKTVSPRAFKRI